MPYKPKYCCECGEKIENVERKLFPSRRFCGLCATDYGLYDWIQRLITGIGLLLTVLFVGSYFQKSDKPLNVVPNQLLSSVQNNKSATVSPNTAPQVLSADSVQNSSPSLNGALPVKSPLILKTADLKNIPPEIIPVAVSEKISFCGAATKKGAPCSRRVKGGGRCWQHIGQAAILSPDKLIISQ